MASHESLLVRLTESLVQEYLAWKGVDVSIAFPPVQDALASSDEDRFRLLRGQVAMSARGSSNLYPNIARMPILCSIVASFADGSSSSSPQSRNSLKYRGVRSKSSNLEPIRVSRSPSPTYSDSSSSSTNSFTHALRSDHERYTVESPYIYRELETAESVMKIVLGGGSVGPSRLHSKTRGSKQISSRRRRSASVTPTMQRSFARSQSAEPYLRNKKQIQGKRTRARSVSQFGTSASDVGKHGQSLIWAGKLRDDGDKVRRPWNVRQPHEHMIPISIADGQRLSSSPYIESSRYREETENRRLRAVMSACPRIVEGYRAPSPRSIVSMRAFSGQSSTRQTSPYSDRKSSSESPHIASHDENFPHSAKQLQSSSSQLSPTSSLYRSELQSESASNRVEDRSSPNETVESSERSISRESSLTSPLETSPRRPGVSWADSFSVVRQNAFSELNAFIDSDSHSSSSSDYRNPRVPNSDSISPSLNMTPVLALQWNVRVVDVRSRSDEKQSPSSIEKSRFRGQYSPLVLSEIRNEKCSQEDLIVPRSSKSPLPAEDTVFLAKNSNPCPEDSLQDAKLSQASQVSQMESVESTFPMISRVDDILPSSENIHDLCHGFEGVKRSSLPYYQHSTELHRENSESHTSAGIVVQQSFMSNHSPFFKSMLRSSSSLDPYNFLSDPFESPRSVDMPPSPRDASLFAYYEEENFMQPASLSTSERDHHS